jgi:hypothetical protein
MLKHLLLGFLLLLTGCATDDGTPVARRLLPGQALATYVPPSGPSPLLLHSLTLHLSEPAQQGCLRLRLVNAVQDDSQLDLRPGKTELLATPLTLSPAQLRASEGTLTLPLAGAHVLLPANGLFLVVECRASTPAAARTAAFPSLCCRAGANSASVSYLQPATTAGWQRQALPDAVSVEMALTEKINTTATLFQTCFLCLNRYKLYLGSLFSSSPLYA